MGTADKALLQMEVAVTPKAMAALTDSGDGQVFTYSGAAVFSEDADYVPDIKPNGIASGRNMLSTHATEDTVTIGAFSAYFAGTLVSIDAGSLAITRPLTDVSKILAICVDATGTFSEEEGTVGTGTAFSETYGAAGGPPVIPDAKIMIGQVRVASSTSAVLTTGEILQAPGVHTERYDSPMWDVYPLGDGDQDAETTAKQTAYVRFSTALDQIHTSGSKPVYAQVYVPTMADIARAAEFVPSDRSYSGNATTYYNGEIVSVTSSRADATFTAYLNDGVTDEILRRKGKVTTFKFYPDRNKDPYILTQGTVGNTRTFPADNQIAASITVVPKNPSVDFAD